MPHDGFEVFGDVRAQGAFRAVLMQMMKFLCEVILKRLVFDQFFHLLLKLR
jgi:hypothetical protein